MARLIDIKNSLKALKEQWQAQVQGTMKFGYYCGDIPAK
jgi:hypothetical protein